MRSPRAGRSCIRRCRRSRSCRSRRTRSPTARSPFAAPRAWKSRSRAARMRARPSTCRRSARSSPATRCRSRPRPSPRHCCIPGATATSRCCARSSAGTSAARKSSMLRALSIRDYVIVDAVELELAAGFSVLTGETGAGKSILIDALVLALGGRADASVVRAGASRADISAEFDVAALPAAKRWLAGQELDEADGACVLRRTVHAQELIATVSECAEALDEGEEAATARLAHAATRLAEAGAIDPALEDARRAAEAALAQAEESAHELRRYLARLDLDPGRLAELDARIKAVMDCARKYRVEPAGIPAALAERRARLAELGG